MARERSGTHHEKGLAQRARALAQDLVRVERDDVAQREDERVHVFHVEVVGGDGVRNRVLGERLRLLGGVAARIERVSARLGAKQQKGAYGVMSSGSSSMGL